MAKNQSTDSNSEHEQRNHGHPAERNLPFSTGKESTHQTHHREKASSNTAHLPPILGFDRNPGAIAAAQSNAERAGLPHLNFDLAPLTESAKLLPQEPGLMVVNPPYGLRIGEAKKLRNLYDSLGACMNGPLAEWEVSVISANRDLLKRLPPELSPVGPPVFHGGTRIYFHVRKH